MVNKTAEQLESTENNPIKKLQKEAQQGRQSYWFKQVLKTLQSLQNSYEISALSKFIAPEQNKSQARFVYGDLLNYRTSAINNYCYRTFLEAFGIKEPSTGTSIPLKANSFLEQDFLGENSVSLSVVFKQDQSSLPNPLFEEALTYFKNLPHTRWAQEFYDQLQEIPISDPDIKTITAQSETLNMRTMLEFSLLLLQFKSNSSLESIIEEVSEKLQTNDSQIRFTTDVDGLTLVLVRENQAIRPQMEIDFSLLENNSQQPFFSDSKTFANIVETFSLMNVQLSTKLERALLEDQSRTGYNPRYGNGYADFSREITKQIGKTPDEIVQNLFKDETVESIKDKLSALPKQDLNSPAGLMFHMLQEMFLSDSYMIDPNFEINRDRSIADGSCKDIETYWASVLEVAKDNPRREILREEGDFMANIGYGRPVAILAKEKTLFGITFPAGFLFHKDGKQISPLRPMISCFSEEESQDAFGWQYVEVKENLDLKSFTNISISHAIRQVFEGF